VVVCVVVEWCHSVVTAVDVVVAVAVRVIVVMTLVVVVRVVVLVAVDVVVRVVVAVVVVVTLVVVVTVVIVVTVVVDVVIRTAPCGRATTGTLFPSTSRMSTRSRYTATFPSTPEIGTDRVPTLLAGLCRLNHLYSFTSMPFTLRCVAPAMKPVRVAWAAARSTVLEVFIETWNSATSTGLVIVRVRMQPFSQPVITNVAEASACA